MKYIGAGLLISLSSLSFGYSQDAGIVTRVFVSSGGEIAIQIEGGFKDSIADGQCASNNGWAGHSSADPVLKAAILAAKASGQSLTVTTEGCNGAWFKVKDLYIN